LPPLKKGDAIDGYRVLSEIGRGAASVIYLVQDQKSKQIWALKQVEKNTEKDQRFLEQAEAEFKVAQAINHPGIRKITRLFKKGSFLAVRELYLVMEFVDGISLDRSPPKTFESACAIFHQVADAMTAMHDAGYVHADMKPNNVVVDDIGTARIIDLGQSCKIGTVKPRIQGTPDYIAPEQVHRRPITPLTDVYNLGATMYWVLTRQHIPTALGKGDSLIGSLDDGMIEPPKPACELNVRIPRKLSDLIMQCVEVEPAKRPPSMRHVAAGLNLVQGILAAKNRAQQAVPDEDD
jgi:eukaryotic-like serine/threonine-protein kinase